MEMMGAREGGKGQRNKRGMYIPVIFALSNVKGEDVCTMLSIALS
jgi:hypothetical protein